MTKNKPLVSIVVPVYNAERFIVDTIKTVQDQTYQNWELILIDDKSTDKSIELIDTFSKEDKRIKLLKNDTNIYAALTRNKGIDAASGRYIAFLDADDIWVNTKLEEQIAFMQEMKCAFSFTGYEFADAWGSPNGKRVQVPSTITYSQALRNTIIFTSTVIFDMSKLTKNNAKMPNLRRGQDTATWWKVLKLMPHANGLDRNLSYYRRTSGTVSSNKLVALKRTWMLYRKQENLGILFSLFNFTNYIYKSALRRI